MGRGRAKAKQTKVARELKYSSPQTDFERLQRELAGSDGSDDLNGIRRDGPTNGAADEDDWRRWPLEPGVLAHQAGTRSCPCCPS